MGLHPALLKILNLITFAVVVSTIVLNREAIQKIVQDHPNFLTNSTVGYIIPAINWFLLGGFTLAQWLDSAHDV
ncbi:hypothetical protein BGZ94_005018, partial [Podila epigama]